MNEAAKNITSELRDLLIYLSLMDEIIFGRLSDIAKIYRINVIRILKDHDANFFAADKRIQTLKKKF